MVSIRFSRGVCPRGVVPDTRGELLAFTPLGVYTRGELNGEFLPAFNGLRGVPRPETELLDERRATSLLLRSEIRGESSSDPPPIVFCSNVSRGESPMIRGELSGMPSASPS